MIKHIVFFRLLDSAQGCSKAENALKIKQLLEGLRGEIAQIRAIEVGLNYNEGPTAWDVALYSEFDTREDLEIYQEHPSHKKVAAFVASVRSDRAVVDYEQPGK